MFIDVNPIAGRFRLDQGRDFSDFARQADQSEICRFVSNRRKTSSLIAKGAILVYLDLRCWIDLANVESGNVSAKSSGELLDALTCLVAAKRIVVPAGPAVYSEIAKTPEPSRRMQLAAIVDRLSQGVGSIATAELRALESRRFLSPNTTYDVILPWQPLGFFELNNTLPALAVHTIANDEYRDVFYANAFQTALLGYATMSELLLIAPDESGSIRVMESDITDGTQRVFDSDPRRPDDKFDELIAIEFEGGIRATSTTELPAEFRECVANLRVEPSDLSIAKHTAPYIYAVAQLNAQMRWDPGRKVSLHDYFDVQHLAFAVAYCDIAIVDRGFRSLAEKGPRALTSDFAAKVFSDYGTAIASLELAAT